jgi:SH3-like domain-containing protein
VQINLKFFVTGVVICLLMPAVASAVDYRTVSVSKAILYDAPSTQGKKLFLIGQGYPVEVIVDLGDWVKIRDHQGSLNWIDAKQLSTKRSVLVSVDQAELRQSADTSSVILCMVAKDVTLDLMEPPNNGWVKVHHRDGIVGYMLAASIWGV